MHVPVLLQKTIDELQIKPGDTFLDATLGGGGHSEWVCQMFGSKVSIVGIDRDEDAINRSVKKLSKAGCAIRVMKGNFRNLDQILDELKISKVNKILFDLGISSDQFEKSGRGFSFQKNEPLLMTMPAHAGEGELTAAEIVNNWEGENIATILKAYGEERFAKRIAEAIVTERQVKPIKTTFDLVEIIRKGTPKFYHSRKIHLATKTFQALRIAVNDEVGALQEGLRKAIERLSSQGRIAVIAFHSIEDRIVKNYFREMAKLGQGKIITKKPIVATREEINANPRSRSAKLRIFEKYEN